jgi:Tfp pilus assembly protein PilN
MRGVEFNLLPQSRAHVIEERARADKIFTKAFNISIIFVGLFLLLFIYTGVIQKAQMNSLTKSIADKSAKVKTVPDILTILTVENQLKTATTLHQGKHMFSRTFNYLGQLTPVNASVTGVQFDTTANTIKIDGVADTANTVNAFIDSLKTAKYKISDSPSNGAFSNVVEQSFAIGVKNVSYSLTANYDPNLFANSTTDSNGKPVTPQLVIASGLTGHTSTDPNSFFNETGR